MTVRESLDLTTFAPAIEQLAAQIDNFSSDEKLIADAAVALCSGIVAMAVFQNAPASSSYGNWEGSLDDHSLSLYSATHQLVFTLESNMFQAAVLTGPSGNTWNVNRSQKGLHVQVVDVTAGSIRNRLIKSDGSIVDPSDISQSVQQLKAEWQEIGRRPESSLPAYVPVGDFIDIDLPDISSLPDVNSPSDPGGSSGGSGGFSPSGGRAVRVVHRRAVLQPTLALSRFQRICRMPDLDQRAELAQRQKICSKARQLWLLLVWSAKWFRPPPAEAVSLPELHRQIERLPVCLSQQQILILSE